MLSGVYDLYKLMEIKKVNGVDSRKIIYSASIKTIPILLNITMHIYYINPIIIICSFFSLTSILIIFA